jgi:hypothetical protein
MLKANECRRKATQSRLEAEAATDPSAKAALRRLAEQWAALSIQVERDEVRASSRPALGLRVRRTARNVGGIDAADVLRARLYLTDDGESEPPRPGSRHRNPDWSRWECRRRNCRECGGRWLHASSGTYRDGDRDRHEMASRLWERSFLQALDFRMRPWPIIPIVQQNPL